MLKHVAVLAVVTSACASAPLETTWRHPGPGVVKLADRKVLGLFIGDPPAFGRSAEDAIARELTAHGAQGVPAYTVLDEAERGDRDRVRRKLSSLAFGGVVVLRVVGSAVEAQVYAVANDELIWAGKSRTVAPALTEGFVAELARAVTKDMVKAGILPPDVDDWGSRLGSDIGLGR